MGRFSGVKVGVFGGGVTGRAVCEFLKNEGARILLLDARPQEIESDWFYLDDSNLNDIPEIELLIKSPGILPDHPLLKQIAKKTKVMSEIDLAWEFFSGKVIGITGTDGKSTTTALTSHLIYSSFPKSKMGGNIGLPFISFCKEELDFAILELSSYQLDDSSLVAPFSSAILNLAPDHLDRHKTMENYLNAKKKIINLKNENSTYVTNVSLKDKMVYEENLIQSRMKYFGDKDYCSAKIIPDKQIILTDHEYNYSEFPLTGSHNLENLAASILLAESVGANPDLIQKSISTFKGLPYRYQVSGEIRGIKFINDSKSTNLHSMLSGIKGKKKENPFILILGGKPKKEDLSVLKSRLSELNSIIFLYGEAKDSWEKELRSSLGERLKVCYNLEEVFKILPARIKNFPVEEVIFSPACASFDQYKNFEERGAHFDRLVKDFRF